MTRLIFSPTQWSAHPNCTRCGQAIRAGESVIVADSSEVARHESCPCPSCGNSTRGSEEWSTGQCDDCFVNTQEDALRGE